MSATLSKEEVISIVYNLLSQMREGIVDFKFHKIVEQTDDHLSVDVGYTWFLNGHEKPIKTINRWFCKEDGKWRILV